MDDNAFKVCPFCKEKIRSSAIKCRFCGEWLEQSTQAPLTQPQAQPELPSTLISPQETKVTEKITNTQNENFPSNETQQESEEPDLETIALGTRVFRDFVESQQMQPSREQWEKEFLTRKKPPKPIPPQIVGKLWNESITAAREPEPKIDMTNVDRKIVEPKSVKTLNIISISLLSVCGIAVVYLLILSQTNNRSPAEQGKALVDIIGSVIKLLILAWFVSWGIKRKGYRFLTFSIVCAVCFAIGAYYFIDARNNESQKTVGSNKILLSNLTSLQKYTSQGAVGDIPEFAATGDSDMDAFFKTTRDFYTVYFQGWRKMNADFDALQELSVSDCLLFTNKYDFEPQILNRIDAQQIIEEFAKNIPTMFENYKQKCEALNLSVAFKESVLKALDRWPSQYEAMFAANNKSQNAEELLLQFLHHNFEDYKIKDGVIIFTTELKKQEYDKLTKAIKDADLEAESYQKQSATAFETSKKAFQ